MANIFLSSQDGGSIFDDPAETRAKLGLIYGSTIQSYDNTLNNLAQLIDGTTAANKIIKLTGNDSFSLLNITSHGEAALYSNEALVTNSSIPQNTSDLTNNSGFIISSSIPTTLSSFTNDSNFITSSSIPTNISTFTNDSGFLSNPQTWTTQRREKQAKKTAERRSYSSFSSCWC